MVRKPIKVYTFLTLLETNGVFEWGILTNANEPRKLVFLDPNGEPVDFTAENRKYDLLDMSCGGYYCLALVQDGKVTCQIGLRGCWRVIRVPRAVNLWLGTPATE